MAQPAQSFVDGHVEKIAPLVRALNLAAWDLSLTGDEECAKKKADLDAALTKLYADRAEFRALETWRREGVPDPVLSRQVDLLYRAYLANQKDEPTIEKMVRLESEVEKVYYTHRGVFEGNPTPDNELRTVLVEETDSGRRRAAWQASKQVGPKVRESVLELVRLRNDVARSVGFPDHYHMALELQELDEAGLLQVLGELEERTREPFAAAKATLDGFLARRFGVPVDDLRPWHYGDFFFQDAPADEAVDLDPLFVEKDLVAIALRTYDRLGLEARDIIGRSDLYAKPGKSQHAFCTCIDRGQDIRTLCNLRPDERWMSTLLHELGHAVYDKYLEPGLPYLLREPAHALTTEAVAMIMGRLTKDEYWLRAVAELDAGRIGKMLPHIREYTSLAMLVFVRWCLVMTHFERDLYRNPQQDLNKLWWDHVERFQMLTRPEGRDEPDWAAKIHLALAPVYYHNYVLGEMVASQLHRYIVDNVDARGVAGGAAVGEFLKERLFSLGARYPWDETLERATGERLSPRYFAEQFVREVLAQHHS